MFDGSPAEKDIKNLTFITLGNARTVVDYFQDYSVGNLFALHLYASTFRAAVTEGVAQEVAKHFLD